MPARPTVSITVRLDVDLYDLLVEHGAKTRTTQAEIVRRALESALGDGLVSQQDRPGALDRAGDVSAQSRTSEESSRSSSGMSEDGRSTSQEPVAPPAKESASPGPASTGSGRGPRRSADVKSNVKPITKASA